MNRPDWLAARRRGLGGSDIAPILGLSRWATAWDVWVSKTGMAPPETEQPWHFRRGHMMEPVILELYAEQVGIAVSPNAESVQGEHPWEVGTPDAFVDAHGLADAKSTTDWAGWGAAGEYRSVAEAEEAGAVGIDQLAQALWYMSITGRDWLDFAVAFVPRAVDASTKSLVERLEAAGLAVEGEVERVIALHLLDQCEVRIFRIYRDEAVIAAIRSKAGAWWRRHIIEGVPPEADASEACSRYLEQVSGQGEDDEPRGVGVRADGPLRDLLVEAVAAKVALDTATVRTRTARNRLHAAMAREGVRRLYLGRNEGSASLSNAGRLTVREA